MNIKTDSKALRREYTDLIGHLLLRCQPLTEEQYEAALDYVSGLAYIRSKENHEFNVSDYSGEEAVNKKLYAMMDVHENVGRAVEVMKYSIERMDKERRPLRGILSIGEAAVDLGFIPKEVKGLLLQAQKYARVLTQVDDIEHKKVTSLNLRSTVYDLRRSHLADRTGKTFLSRAGIDKSESAIQKAEALNHLADLFATLIKETRFNSVFKSEVVNGLQAMRFLASHGLGQTVFGFNKLGKFETGLEIMDVCTHENTVLAGVTQQTQKTEVFNRPMRAIKSLAEMLISEFTRHAAEKGDYYVTDNPIKVKHIERLVHMRLDQLGTGPLKA